MQSIQFISSQPIDDTELVRETRSGNREAFRQIVTRYQSLVCSLAYSGTGNLSRSEDIAQETFVTAWKRLSDLREPANLRAWLCGIARNLISNAQRHAAREPTASADAIDAAREPPSPESSPTEQVIRAEEEAILWSTIGKIPMNYREPLILFYREHQSVAQVASALGLTEDAAKQRLSRGRALLQERVLALVEGTLARTKPGDTFTANVLAALPLASASMAASLGASSAKSSTITKAGATGGAGFFGAMIGLLGLLGGYVGWQMSNAASDAERAWITRFWRHLIIGTAVFIGPALILPLFFGRSHPWVLEALSYWLLVFYAYVGAPLAIWAWQNHTRIRERPTGAARGGISGGLLSAFLFFAALSIVGPMAYGFPSGAWTDLWLKIVFALTVLTAAVLIWDWRQRHASADGTPQESQAPRSNRISRSWIAAATALMAMLLILSMGGGWRAERVSSAAMAELVLRYPDAQIHVSNYTQGIKTVGLVARVNGKTTRYLSRADETVLEALRKSGAPYKTLQQGRDFEVLGPAGRSLFLVAVLAAAAGLVMLLTGIRNRGRSA